MLKKLLFLYTFLFSGFSVIRAEVSPLFVTPTMKGVDLTSFLQYYHDESSETSYAEARVLFSENKFKPLPRKNMGFYSGVFWLRLEIVNNTSRNIRWFLEFDYPVFDSVQVFSSDSGEAAIYQSGDIYPFNDRPTNYRNPAFPMTDMAFSRKIVYLRLLNDGSMNAPLYAHTTGHFFNKVSIEQFLLGIYYGILVVMFFYNLFLSVSTHDKNYLVYSVFILCYGFFQLTMNGLAFQYLWPENTVWAGRALLFFIPLAALAGLEFAYRFLQIKRTSAFLKKIYRSFQVLCIFTAILVLEILPYRVALILCMGIALIFVVVVYSSGIRGLFRGQKSARFFVLAWSIFLLGVALITLQSVGIIPDVFFTRWSIQIGSGIELALLSFALADRINDLRSEVREKETSLADARLQIEQSEQLTTEILKASPDIIFTFDKDLKVLSANGSLYKALGVRMKEAIGKGIETLLYTEHPGEEAFNKLYIRERLRELSELNPSIELTLNFLHKFLGEPRETNLLLRLTSTNETIIGIATPATVDQLLSSVVRESIVFSVNNFLKNAEMLSERLTLPLRHRLSLNEVTIIKNALKELLINAIEHGNLAIDFAHKSSLLQTGEYFSFLHERQKQTEYKNRHVKVDYMLRPDFVFYRISDEGNGFDFTNMLQQTEQGAGTGFHGRGIAMAKIAFDKLEYSGNGNTVIAVKKL